MSRRYEIDGMLKVLTPESVAAYEGNVLGSKTLLARENEEYKLAWTVRDALRIFEPVLLFVSLVLSFYLAFKFFPSVNWRPTLMGWLEVAVVIGLVFKAPMIAINKLRDVQDRTITQASLVLEAFKKAVWAIDPDNDLPEEGKTYERESVRDILVEHATEVLDAESKFEAERTAVKANISCMMFWGNLVTICQERFSDSFKSSQAFGFGLDKRELFKEAGKKLAARSVQ